MDEAKSPYRGDEGPTYGNPNAIAYDMYGVSAPSLIISPAEAREFRQWQFQKRHQRWKQEQELSNRKWQQEQEMSNGQPGYNITHYNPGYTQRRAFIPYFSHAMFMDGSRHNSDGSRPIYYGKQNVAVMPVDGSRPISAVSIYGKHMKRPPISAAAEFVGAYRLGGTSIQETETVVLQWQSASSPRTRGQARLQQRF